MTAKGPRCMRIRCLVNSKVTGRSRSATGYSESSPQTHSWGPAALQQLTSFKFDNNLLMSNTRVRRWQVRTPRLTQVPTSSCQCPCSTFTCSLMYSWSQLSGESSCFHSLYLQTPYLRLGLISTCKIILLYSQGLKNTFTSPYALSLQFQPKISPIPDGNSGIVLCNSEIIALHFQEEWC